MSRPVLNFKSRGLSTRWVAAISAAREVIAFSPFISTSAATKALESKGGACQLYTVVSAENFASGGSKLSCLWRLFRARVRIYHLDDLHAKLLLLPGEFVTVGSQNLTQGGTSNLEATVLWSDPNAAKEAREGIQSWMDAGKLVTETFIKNLEAEVKKLQHQHRAWKKAAKAATEGLWEQWRQEEERKRRAAEAAAAARRKHRAPVFKARYASSVIRGEVIEQQGGWSLSNKDQYPPASYCQWNVDWQDEPLKLPIGKWRPCFHLDTLQWGKARVWREVISFIDRSMGWGQKFTVGGQEYRIGLSCREASGEHREMNLQFGVYHFGERVWGDIIGQYNTTSLSAELVQPDELEYYGEEDKFDLSIFNDLVEAINDNADGLQESLLKMIYGGWNKAGLSRSKRVDKFFEKGDVIYTGLRSVAGYNLLVFSKSKSKVVGKPSSLFE